MAIISLTAGVIAVMYLICKFLEMRFIAQETKPVKVLVQDALLVYVSVLMAGFVMDQFATAVDGKKQMTPVFTDNPAF